MAEGRKLSEPAKMKMTRRDACDMKTELLQLFPLYPIPKVAVDNQAAMIETHRNGIHVDSDYLATIFAFRDRRWNQINGHVLTMPANDSTWMTGSYHFLTLEAFRYYFPAWINMALEPPEDAYGIYDEICNSLNPEMYREENQSIFNDRFNSLSSPQKSLIAKFLRHIASVASEFLGHDPATPAYNAYWAQFDDKTGGV